MVYNDEEANTQSIYSDNKQMMTQCQRISGKDK